MSKFNEHIKRSLVKSITFRLIVIISDGIIIYSITHKYEIAAAVILLSNISSTILYFAHDRVWNKIDWGKQ